MHVVGVGGFGGRIIARRSSRPAMAGLKMMPILHTPRCTPSRLSGKSFHSTNPVLDARSWPNPRRWSSQQIRADTGVAVSDSSKVRVCGSGVMWVLLNGVGFYCNVRSER